MTLELPGYELLTVGVYIKNGFLVDSVTASTVATITYFRIPNAHEIAEQLQKEDLKDKLHFPAVRSIIRNDAVKLVESCLPEESDEPGNYLIVKYGFFPDKEIEDKNIAEINSLFLADKQGVFGALWFFKILYEDFTLDWVDDKKDLFPEVLKNNDLLIKESEDFLYLLTKTLDDPKDLLDQSENALKTATRETLEQICMSAEYTGELALFSHESLKKAFGGTVE